MRVYVKKDDKYNMTIRVAFTMAFLLLPIVMLIGISLGDKPFIEILESSAIGLVFCFIFFCLGICMVYYLIKKPKGYKAKLINKKIEMYEGKQITYMEFSIEQEIEKEDLISPDYECYTIEGNNFVVGHYYSLKIKEFNWEPKYIEEINGAYENENSKVKNKIPNTSINLIFILVVLILLSILLFCILGIIMYPEYIKTYILGIIFLIVAILISYKVYKMF